MFLVVVTVNGVDNVSLIKTESLKDAYDILQAQLVAPAGQPNWGVYELKFIDGTAGI